MALTYGPKGYPKHDGTSNGELWPKLEEVGQFAAKVGNRRVGTQAERDALSASTTEAEQASVGLEFHETDTGKSWLCTAVSPQVTWRRISKPVWSNLAPAGALGEAFPASEAEPIFHTGYGRIAPLGASGEGVMTFTTPFPNSCQFFTATTIEGSPHNPVIDNVAGGMTKDGVNLAWKDGANVTVRFVWFAVGL